MYTLYGYPKTRSFRIAWALEEAGVDYHYEIVDLKSGAHKSSDFKAKAPSQKVPVLHAEGQWLSESAAILVYLANVHGTPLMPEQMDNKTLGRLMQMQFFVACELEQPLWTAAKHKFALPEEHRRSGMVETAVWEYQRALEQFACLLGDAPYAGGDVFSFVDILATHTLDWASGFGLPCEFDNVNNYHSKLRERDAYARGWKREKAELEKKNAP